MRADILAEGVMGCGWGMAGWWVGIPIGVDLIWGEVLIPMETAVACALRREEWCLTLKSSASGEFCFLTLISNSDLRSKTNK